MEPQAVFEAAAALSETDRLKLAIHLLETLGPQTDDIDGPAFLEELDRRSAEIDQGTAELIRWSDLKSESF